MKVKTKMSVIINRNDTIVAISTPLGDSGIGIVRLSGSKALQISNKIFVGRNGKTPSQFASFSVHYGFIVDKRSKNIPRNRKYKVIDEVLLTVMRRPCTYTKEDIVEINCHGGIIPLKKVLNLVISSGARLAQPGEFTQRAFLNGRIDLVQAEAVLNIINARTDTALTPAMNQLQGNLSHCINDLRRRLIEIIAPFEAAIDFPDEEIDPNSAKKLTLSLLTLSESMQKLINGADKGIMLQNGINMVLTGSANVGKSSLMNALLDYERVIVTHISGTTRDIVEEIINIDGLPVKIADTAGIMDSSCFITRESINRSVAFLNKADLILFILDGSRKINKADIDLAGKLKGKNLIIVINKSDLKLKINVKDIRKILGRASVVNISALKKIGLDRLKKQIVKLFFNGEIATQDTILISNLRQKEALEKSHRYIKQAISIAKGKGYEECLIFEAKQALDALDEVVGKQINDDILNTIFSRFCIGK